jgi:alpha-galactosidase
MAMNMWAIQQATPIHSIGLCHSVFNTARELSEDLQVPFEEIRYTCAGINHMAFYLSFEQKTKQETIDLYPRIKKVIEEKRVPSWNKVRYKIFQHFGYFVTESSEHFSEYVPWFIKRDRPDLVSQYNIPLDEYITRCEMQNALFEIIKEKLDKPEGSVDEIVDEIIKVIEAYFGKIQTSGIRRFLREIFDIKPSAEYAPLIIHGMETGAPYEIYGNVKNSGLIDNLPAGCVVEVPCLVNKNRISPVRIGSLPIQLAALIQTNINVQALTVEAALTRNREYIYQAAMLDPHTAAELDIDQIRNLVDDLIEAHGKWLPSYH